MLCLMRLQRTKRGRWYSDVLQHVVGKLRLVVMSHGDVQTFALNSTA